MLEGRPRDQSLRQTCYECGKVEVISSCGAIAVLNRIIGQVVVMET